MEKILMKEGKKYLVKGDFHSTDGLIKYKSMKKGLVKSNKGEKFYCWDATFADKLRKIKRGAQIITIKDAGIIIGETGIGPKSKCIDAGGGSGALTCMLGNVAGSVISYEIREDFVKIIKKNVEDLELTNIKIKNKDITKGITERNIDLITLDLPEPTKVLPHVEKALKIGGFLVIYVPSMTQVIEFVKKTEKTKKFYIEKVIENIQRKWKIEGRIARPEFRMLGHTGFLIFCRRID